MTHRRMTIGLCVLSMIAVIVVREASLAFVSLFLVTPVVYELWHRRNDHLQFWWHMQAAWSALPFVAFVVMHMPNLFGAMI